MNRKLSYLRILSVIFLMMFAVSSCNDDDAEDLVGNWVDRYEFEGVARSHAVSFTIGDKAYVVSGYDGVEREYLQDCWEFNPESNQWTRMDSFPGIGRTGSCAFVVNGKGYVVGGYDGENEDKLKDVWEFNPSAAKGSQWSAKNDFVGTARYGAVAFTVNGSGYICSGYDGSHLKELWQYDPTGDSWNQKASIPGSKRYNASVFVINDIAYVFGGNSNGQYVDDFWAYDYSTDTWTAKRDIADNDDDNSYDDDYDSIVRECGATFVINGYGYVATGYSNGVINTTWEYDPSTDLWTEKTGLEGTARTNAIGITVNNRGFILTGRASSSYFDDVWEFHPFEDQVDND
ncbi:MAG: Kelch repeat-containing protein [Bacteroidales bacterium]